MTDWKFDYHDVLIGPEGYWWHVAERYESRDTGDRLYYLWDGTHTADDYARADYVESEYSYAGWSTDTKPAFEYGFRVNGILTEPANVDRWRGQECQSEYGCGDCGEDTMGDADIITNYANQEVLGAWIDCQACGTKTAIGD